MNGTVRTAIISIHDVAPATLSQAITLRELVRETAGEVPVSILVVPCYHGRSGWSAAAIDWVAHAARAGDELVIHGLAHCNPTGIDGAEFGRRVCAPEVQNRLRRARLCLGQLGLSARGFIAPAYAHPPVLDDALHELGFSWWATRGHLYSRCATHRLPSFGLGTSTVLRRVVSPVAAAVGARALAPAHAIRLDLHPADLAYARLRGALPSLIDGLVAQNRCIVTHAEILDRPGVARSRVTGTPRRVR